MSTNGIRSFQKLTPNNLTQVLVEFIEGELPDFPSSNEFQVILNSRKNENVYTIAFLLYLMNKRNPHFNFINEQPQKSSNTVDVGVYWGTKLFYTLEAKILPTPLGSKRKAHEYVYGKGGGIERFKNRNHGIDHDGNILPNSGLIAYVESEDYPYWLDLINKWIDDAKWGKDEHLKKIKLSVSARLCSKHATTNNPIELDHFWIKV